MTAYETAPKRRSPTQQRSQQTVEAVLEAVPLVLKRYGARAVTTNRVAEVAGVSIGSLYQYFADKQAIFAALHTRHVGSVQRVMERTIAECAPSSLEEFARELVEQLTLAHAEDAELHEMVSLAVPGSAEGFQKALQTSFERVLSPSQQERYPAEEAARMLFVLPQMVAALVHGVAHQKQALAWGRAKDEAIRTVAVYLQSYRGSHLCRY